MSHQPQSKALDCELLTDWPWVICTQHFASMGLLRHALA